MKNVLFHIKYLYLLAFFVVFGVAAYTSAATPDKTGESNETLDTAAYAAEVRSCLEFENEAEQIKCIDKVLILLAEQKGIPAALGVIEPLSQEFTYLLSYSHPFGHTIGNHGITYYGGPDTDLKSRIGKALVECDGFGAFACYHGVIETALSYLPIRERPTVIREACMENPLIQETQYYINQCLHWFGHGMAIFADVPLKETLALCDGLSDEFLSDDVQLCLSGVFHAGSQPGSVDGDLLHNIENVWSEDDLYYPCGDIEEKFRGHCYSHVPGRTQTADLTDDFEGCDNIPEPDPVKRDDYIRRCYDSAANSLLIQLLNQSDLSNEEKITQIIESCRAYSDKEYVRFCYAGTVRYWVLFDPLLTNKNPFQLCRKVEEEAKAACYGNIGFGNNENYYSEEILREYCANSEPAYVESCLNKRVL